MVAAWVCAPGVPKGKTTRAREGGGRPCLMVMMHERKGKAKPTPTTKPDTDPGTI